MKMHHFNKGLNSRIQSALAVIEPTSFDIMMGAAIRAENDILRRENENKLKLLILAITNIQANHPSGLITAIINLSVVHQEKPFILK